MDTPTTTPAYTPPSNSAPHTQKRRALLIGAALVLVIIIALVSMPSVRTAWALRGLAITGANYESITVEKFGLFGRKSLKLRTEGTLGDYARAGRHEAAIVAEPGTGASQVILLGKEPRTLTTDSSRKAAVAIDPSGERIAYASTENPSEDIASWRVHLVDLTRGETIDLGVGFAPTFFTHDGKTHLAFTTTNGITFLDVDARTAITLPLVNVPGTRYAATVSPDGTRVAVHNALTQTHDIFAFIRDNETARLSAVESTRSGFSHMAWKGTMLYGVTEPVDGTVHIMSVDPTAPGEARDLHAFPSENTYRLIP